MVWDVVSPSVLCGFPADERQELPTTTTLPSRPPCQLDERADLLPYDPYPGCKSANVLTGLPYRVVSAVHEE